MLAPLYKTIDDSVGCGRGFLSNRLPAGAVLTERVPSYLAVVRSDWPSERGVFCQKLDLNGESPEQWLHLHVDLR
jgi:hypothetical protein